MENYRHAGLLEGLSIARGVRSISYSQFGYDTIILGGAYTIIARRLKIVLDEFLEAYGEKVNERKSKMYG